jgi:hypothetical protein
MLKGVLLPGKQERSAIMFIVIYRPHGELECDTKYYGAFDTFNAACGFLESLPALGSKGCFSELAGVKFVQELTQL